MMWKKIKNVWGYFNDSMADFYLMAIFLVIFMAAPVGLVVLICLYWCIPAGNINEAVRWAIIIGSLLGLLPAIKYNIEAIKSAWKANKEDWDSWNSK